MPNRIIKESICTSESIDNLSWFEETFWYRLMVNCDDYGRMDARPAVLKSRLFPLKEGVTLKQVDAALSKLSTAGMVQVYMYDQKPFLQLINWGKHQTVRNKRSKYPEPPALEINCLQVQADVPVIQSLSESESLSESGLPGAEAPDSIIGLTLNDKTEYFISHALVEEWRELFPAVDVMQELRNMRAWLNSNQTRRKTRSGILRFITGWLSKEQNKGGSREPRRKGEREKSFAEIVAEREGL